jgi:hypothetical protein
MRAMAEVGAVEILTLSASRDEDFEPAAKTGLLC